MANLTDTIVDDNDEHVDLLSDNSSLWDVPTNVGESCDFSDFGIPEDDAVCADIYNEIDEYANRREVSDSFVPKSDVVTFGSDSLRRHVSKNAVLARKNREKKKQYIFGLEESVRDLSAKNKELVRGCTEMRNTVASLRREVSYLRGVIENQSELARLLQHIPAAVASCELNMNDECAERKADGDDIQSLSPSTPDSLCVSVHMESEAAAGYQCLLTEHDYAQSEMRSVGNDSSRHNKFGVCLHVANEVTSLQLCAACNDNAH